MDSSSEPVIDGKAVVRLYQIEKMEEIVTVNREGVMGVNERIVESEIHGIFLIQPVFAAEAGRFA
jgi:hypothetical protein